MARTTWGALYGALLLAASCHLVGGVDDVTFEPDGAGGASNSASGETVSSTSVADSSSSAGGAGGVGASGGGATSAGGVGGTGGEPFMCGHDEQPPPGSCPPECTSCEGSQCIIQCDASDPMNVCINQYTTAINCPAGWDCRVVCTGGNACRALAGGINCPLGHRCEVGCVGNGSNTCRDLMVNCAAEGPCIMRCDLGNNRCRGAQLKCGDANCGIQCMGTAPAAQWPSITCPNPGAGCVCATSGGC